MQGLVERGYYTPSDILQQLNKYYQTLPVRPDKSDPKFYPSIERVRSLTYSHMMKQRYCKSEKREWFFFFFCCFVFEEGGNISWPLRLFETTSFWTGPDSKQLQSTNQMFSELNPFQKIAKTMIPIIDRV